MTRLPLAIIAIAALFSCAAVAAVSIAPSQKAAICGKRTTCAVTALHKAGSASVAEIHFGLKDKPDDAPDDGCIVNVNSAKKDGGTEYWLLGAAPLQLLALCNDGYGSAGVGEDDVSFGDNRLTYTQSGGSAWRSSDTTVYSLVPFRALSTDNCSYNDLGTETGTQTVTDEVKFRAAIIAKNPGAHWGDNDELSCLETKPAMFANPKPYPVAKGVMALPVLSPADNATLTVPYGATLGTCSSSLSTDGKSGFVTFGTPVANGAADVRLVAYKSGQAIVAQIYDPAPSKPAAGRSWTGGSHLEIWSGGLDQTGALKRGDLSQVAVDLDGAVHAVGNAPAPQVTRWQAKDDKGRPVTVLQLVWPDTASFNIGAVSYSQSDNGKQMRLVANTPIEHGVPVYVPPVVTMQSTCAIRNGRLEVKQ
jgi:hypothetical protein